MKRITLLIFTSLICILINGCSSSPEYNRFSQYEEFIAEHPGSNVSITSAKKTFENLFLDLRNPELNQLIQTHYAETIFFNDTLVTISDRKSLEKYFTETQHKLIAYDANIVSVTKDKKDFYVHWMMDFKTDDIHSKSFGVSHLRFNQAGQIILHQDYWDSTQGLFEHLPMIGQLLQWVKSRF